VTTPDLQPTQPLATVPEHLERGQPGFEAPRRGAGILGFVVRIVVLVVLACAATLVAALLLTPASESVLIMGSDARPDELKRGEVGRTDTMLLYVADRATPRMAILSVPRDLWVAVPGNGQERINAAYELGGGQTAKQTVSNVLGQHVDRYLVIGLQGVRDVVDAAGGVDLTVPYAIHDDTYPTDDYGYQTVDFKPGPQHLDGDLALKYARTRHQDSDFARSARQQQVLGAVRNAMLNPLNWPRIPSVIAATLGSIKTDVTPLDAIAVGAAMLRYPADADHLVIETSLVREITGADGAYLLEPRPELKPAVARFLGGSSSAVRIEVLNAAGVAGLAARTADRLSQAGFTVANVGDAQRPQPQTSINAKPAARSTAEQIAAAVGIPSSRVTTNANLATDIQIVLGADAH